MKFKVRERFAVHIAEIVEINGGDGRKTKERKVTPHFAGDIVEMSADEARKHLHKLEPIDAEAVALLNEAVGRTAQVAGNFGGEAAALSKMLDEKLEKNFEELIEKKVKERLAAMGKQR